MGVPLLLLPAFVRMATCVPCDEEMSLNGNTLLEELWRFTDDAIVSAAALQVNYCIVLILPDATLLTASLCLDWCEKGAHMMHVEFVEVKHLIDLLPGMFGLNKSCFD